MSEIDSELVSLYDAEKAFEQLPPDGAQARVLSAVRERIAAGGGGGEGGGGPPSPPTMSRSRALAGMVGTALIGGAIGAAVVFVARPREVVVIEKNAVVAPAVVTTAPPAPQSSPAISAADLPSVPQAPSPQSSNLDGSGLAAERALLDTARVALARGELDKVLDAVARHERDFPKGKLAEEREAIAVRALARAGRRDEARARGERFLRSYPQSLAVPAVRGAIEVAP